jgi:hypothetical protein
MAPIEDCLTVWHEFLRGDRDALDRVLADEVVLHSPVLFTPQAGKETVKLYLTGASMTFVGEPGGATASEPKRHPDRGEWDGRFRYVRQVLGERDAVLEFETTMRGAYVNGVDMIACDDDGRITDFKVMVRPQKAVEAVREMMMAALEQLKA